jgi:hypothetical protein
MNNKRKKKREGRKPRVNKTVDYEGLASVRAVSWPWLDNLEAVEATGRQMVLFSSWEWVFPPCFLRTLSL